MKNLSLFKKIFKIEEMKLVNHKPSKLEKKEIINDEEKVNKFIEMTGLKCTELNLIPVIRFSTNAYEIRDNMIFFYPPNDGMPRYPFEFYKNGKKVIDNRNSFINITNLDDILIQMTRLFSLGLDNDIIINPYCFMLELNGDINYYYHGTANLVLTDKSIKNNDINYFHLNDARVYYVNAFLDHFIKWNFGLSVCRNKVLKEELEKLNEKVIDLGLKEDIGIEYKVYGTDDEIYNQLGHTYLYKSNLKRIK